VTPAQTCGREREGKEKEKEILTSRGALAVRDKLTSRGALAVRDKLNLYQEEDGMIGIRSLIITSRIEDGV
jgi:hypothetical protein